MHNRQLPAKPNLEQYKKIAKEFVKAWQNSEPTAIVWEGSIVTVTREHIKRKHPRLRNLTEEEMQTANVTLADAQFLIAREYGFENWAEFSKFIEHGDGSADDMQFQRALGSLMQGNFTELESMLGGPDSFDEQIIKWHGQRYFEHKPEELAEFFTCACMLGRERLAEFLLDNGADPIAGMRTGLNGFHYAASSGRLDVVNLLIKHRVPMEIKNMYGGTVLGQALWSAMNEFKPDHAAIIKALLDAGAEIEPETLEWWEEQYVPDPETKRRVTEALRKERNLKKMNAPRKVVHTHHVLAVKNLKVSADYFKNALGFELRFTAPGWEFLAFGDFKVMLGECTDAMWARETGDHSYFAHCLVENIDEIYEELKSRGADIIHPIADKPWGLREFGVVTPDGHRIVYGQEIG